MHSPMKGSSGKKNFLTRTWDRYRNTNVSLAKKKVAPEGFFPVYVGPEKQWFAVKTKYVNHPLFRTLLQDTETEYGYNTPGPIVLPCEVDLFYRVVAEMEAKETESYGFGFGFGYGLCSPFHPSLRFAEAQGVRIGKEYGGYGVLTRSSLIKMK
ncbi:hypothetical protein M8C21_015676 [Ambrosia artemisiifolia]|uniref:Small auxin-up RNA n=1 Tax=Ambrosia artemisiifolia TaxID=4212 RepID=A0AAD5H0H0_AMBAR|nr:hypothetical protein M8C21_015676 [Ambrosia artemisiifolia]